MEWEDEETPPAYASISDPSNNQKPSRSSVRRKSDAAVNCLMRAVKLVRSMGGLIVLLLAYTFLGAWIMMKIEGPAEDAQKIEVYNMREKVAEGLKNNTNFLRAGLISETEWENRTEALLLNFETTVHTSGVASISKKKWTFFGAVLFCVTTYTTIGYGNIAPSTTFGRVATMLYATIGIPLTLIVLADLGRRLAVALKFLWGFIRRYYYTGYCKKARNKVCKRSYDMNESLPEGNSRNRDDAGEIQRKGSYQDLGTSYRYNPEATEEMVGESGDGSARKADGAGAKGKIAGASKSSSITGSARDSVDGSRRSQSVERESLAKASSEGSATDSHNVRKRKVGSIFLDEAELSEEFKLPVLVALGFIFVYIFLGAGLYQLWEDWTYLESFYFVFITTSTIGFGDVLPEHPNFFLLSCVYTFFGLALVSMVINVIMEFLEKTIDRAKLKVDQAKEKAVAKAKVAKGKICEVSTRAKNKVCKVASREGSASPKLRENVELKISIKEENNENGQSNQKQLSQSNNTFTLNGNRQLNVQDKTPAMLLPSPVSEKDETSSFRTADDLTASVESISESEKKQ